MNGRKLVLLGILVLAGLLSVYTEAAADFVAGFHKTEIILIVNGVPACPDGMVPVSPNLQLQEVPKGHLTYADRSPTDAPSCVGLLDR